MVILINRFTVTGDPAEFEQVFEASSEYMINQPGFQSHQLVRSLRTPTSYVNVAIWDSPQAHLAVVRSDGFAEHIAQLARVATAEPDLYQVVLDRERQDA